METSVSATHLARNLGVTLARVQLRHESFVVEKNGRPVARVVPLTDRVATLRDVLDVWASAPPDADFADVLEQVGRDDAPAENPWV